MKHIRLIKLSEKAKDRVLNLALVGSLVLLAGVFLHPPEMKRSGTVGSTGYSVVQLKTLDSPELPTFETLKEEPVNISSLSAGVSEESTASGTPQNSVAASSARQAFSGTKASAADPTKQVHTRRTLLGTLEKLINL